MRRSLARYANLSKLAVFVIVCSVNLAVHLQTSVKDNVGFATIVLLYVSYARKKDVGVA